MEDGGIVRNGMFRYFQDMRHKCSIAGVQSKCHVCEDIKCGAYRVLRQPDLTQQFTENWRATGQEATRTKIFQGLVSESDFSDECSMQIQGV